MDCIIVGMQTKSCEVISKTQKFYLTLSCLVFAMRNPYWPYNHTLKCQCELLNPLVFQCCHTVAWSHLILLSVEMQRPHWDNTSRYQVVVFCLHFKTFSRKKVAYRNMQAFTINLSYVAEMIFFPPALWLQGPNHSLPCTASTVEKTSWLPTSDLSILQHLCESPHGHMQGTKKWCYLFIFRVNGIFQLSSCLSIFTQCSAVGVYSQ